MTYEKRVDEWEVHVVMKYCYTCVGWSSSALIEASQQAVTKVQIAYCVYKNNSTFFTYKYIFYPATPLALDTSP